MSDDEHDDGQPELSLVMPFLNVASQGGRYDDNAFCAGYEMGLLDARLEYEQPALLEQTIHADNAEQADLIAMNRGYSAQTQVSEVDGWSYLKLMKTATL